MLSMDCTTNKFDVSIGYNLNHTEFSGFYVKHFMKYNVVPKNPFILLSSLIDLLNGGSWAAKSSLKLLHPLPPPEEFSEITTSLRQGRCVFGDDCLSVCLFLFAGLWGKKWAEYVTL